MKNSNYDKRVFVALKDLFLFSNFGDLQPVSTRDCLLINSNYFQQMRNFTESLLLVLAP